MSNKVKGILITLLVISVIVCLYLIFGWHNEKYVKEYKKDGYIYTVSFNQKTYKPGDKLIVRAKIENVGPQRKIEGCSDEFLSFNPFIHVSIDLSNIITNQKDENPAIGGCDDGYRVPAVAFLNPGDVKKSTYSATIKSNVVEGDYYFTISMLNSEIQVPVKITP